MVLGARFFLAAIRSVHELVWAWLFVAAVGLSPMAAILALAIPYGGILGRIYSEILDDVPSEPIRALRVSGASEWKVFLYGRLSMAMPDILSYTFYRLECAIRAAAIMSFVGIAGLGYPDTAIPGRPAIRPGVDAAFLPGGTDTGGGLMERRRTAQDGVMSRNDNAPRATGTPNQIDGVHVHAGPPSGWLGCLSSGLSSWPQPHGASSWWEMIAGSRNSFTVRHGNAPVILLGSL